MRPEPRSLVALLSSSRGGTGDPHGCRLWQHGFAMREPGDHEATVPAQRKSLPPRRRSLLVMRGDDVEVRTLPFTGEVTVGRGSQCEVRIDHPSMSRSHLVLTLDDAEVRITDQGSANGTSLRGVRLPASVPVQISANEAISAGDVVLVVQEVRPGAAPGAAAVPARPSGQVARSPAAPVVVDPAMKRLYELAARVARGAIGVLLVGETGAGKEVLAEFVHHSSPRGRGPLVRVNCAALTDTLIESELFGHERGAFTGAQRERRGLIEAADGGTVFLDEVGEISAAVQAKLLRVLEERHVTRVGGSDARPVDVRFVAATNRDLEAEVTAGRFRRDLYFRLAGAVLAIPPLRDRPLEIEVLARSFATEAAARVGRGAPRIDPAALDALRAHSWPGNVRELRNVIERAVLLIDDATIEVSHLALGAGVDAPSAAPPATTPVAAAPAAAAAAGANLSDELAALERQRILDALDQCGGNQTRAAELLGIPRRTFVKRLEQYGVPRPRKR
jgi:two-component system, NtrC family, response regulator AtoC